MSVSKNGHPIRSLDDWFRYAPPKSPNHWQDHRSAKEAARVWLGVESPALPREVATALAGHAAFGPVREWTAEPEVKLRFDDLPGEVRNTDLLVRGRDDFGPLLLAVEAKADEEFAGTVEITLRAARQRLATNPRSGGVKRIDQLVHSLFGVPLEAEPSLAALRYQLLTATAGALALTQRNPGQRVVLMVQEFITAKTKGAHHARNAADLDAFTARLTGGRIRSVPSGTVCGPISLPDHPLFQAETRFFIGKASTNLRSSTPA